MQKSSFLKLLIQDLKTRTDPSNTNTTLYETPIKLLLLQKKQVFYVTDGSIVIQATMSMPNAHLKKDQEVKPFNFLRTNFYNFSTKLANLFLFNEQDRSENNKNWSVYEPQFHFQDRIEGFNRELAMCQFAHLMEVLLVKQWRAKIVNIANTGSYGIVMEILRYERIREKFALSKSLHSVLYEKQLASILEDLRIKDMRKQIGEPGRKNPISLCYYHKNIKITNINKSIQSNFVIADRNGKFLVLNPQLKQHYLPLGNVTGVLRFIRPLTNYSENKKPIINFSLFREMPDRKKDGIDQEVVEKEWSQTESDSEPNDDMASEQEEEEENLDEEEEESSDEDEEELLRLIYMRQLKKSQII